MKKQMPIIKDIRENWMLVVFIGGLIVGWTTINARLTQAENDVEQLSEVVSEINQININLAKVSKDVEYIKVLLDDYHK